MAVAPSVSTPIILTGPAGCGKSHWIRQYAEQQKRQICICPCRKDRTLREGRQKLHLWGKRTESAIIWLEGADDLTPDAQAFLRRILETHASQVQFILECRNAGKLQEPIRSRCILKRMAAPTWESFESYLLNFHNIPINEIKEYLLPHEYSWRRIHTCIYLCTQHPEIWQQCIQTRKQEKSTVLDIQNMKSYIESALDPNSLIASIPNPTFSKDYGTCIEEGGSIWALIGKYI